MDDEAADDLARADDLSDEGRFAEAEPIYRRVIDRQVGLMSRYAAMNLGCNLMRQDREVEALDLFRLASSDSTDQVDWPNIYFAALLNLGTTLMVLDHHISEVARALGPVMASGQSCACSAAWTLGSVLAEAGRDDEAIDCYRQAMAGARPEVVLRAAAALGLLLQQRGDLAGAEHALGVATVMGDRGSMLSLGDVLRDQGRRHEAMLLYRDVAGSGTADSFLASMARARLEALGGR